MKPARSQKDRYVSKRQLLEKSKKYSSDSQFSSLPNQAKIPAKASSASGQSQTQKVPNRLPSANYATKKCKSASSENGSKDAVVALQSAISTLNDSAKLYEQITDRCESGGVGEGDDSDVKLINIPSVWEKGSKKVASAVNKLSVEKILQAAQETDANKVYEVDLHGQKIAALQHFDKFKKLRVLDLSCNLIENIDNLHFNTDLRELRLYDNSITAIANLESLKELVNLYLQSNRIDRIGRGVSHLRKLKTLRLDSNYIFALEKKEITSLGQLTYLDLSHNRLTDISAISCLPQLEELLVKGNKLSIVPDLHLCFELKEIDISSNSIEDLSGLKSLAKLTLVNVADNRLKSLRSLGKLKCLEDLDASSNQLSDLSYLPELFPNLEVFNVSNNCVQNVEELCSLCNLNRLVELEAHHNPCTVQEDGQQIPDYPALLLSKIPNLDMLDGVSVKLKKSSSATSVTSSNFSRPTTPLMRPMTPAATVSSKQMEGQISDMRQLLSTLETQFIKSVDHVRTEIAIKLPERPVSRASTQQSGQQSRPVSSRRMKLQEAVKWATENQSNDDFGEGS